MSKLGGYQIVNLAGVNLTDTGVTFKGLYGRLFKDIGKPVLLSGVVLFNQSYQDCYVQPVYTLEGFKMTVGDYTVTVTVDDLVVAVYGIVGGGGSGSDIPPLNPDGAGEVLTNIGSETMGWVPNHDVPSGGLSGQVLAKASDSDYALQWKSLKGVPVIYVENSVLTIGTWTFPTTIGNNVNVPITKQSGLRQALVDVGFGPEVPHVIVVVLNVWSQNTPTIRMRNVIMDVTYDSSFPTSPYVKWGGFAEVSTSSDNKEIGQFYNVSYQLVISGSSSELDAVTNRNSYITVLTHNAT